VKGIDGRGAGGDPFDRGTSQTGRQRWNIGDMIDGSRKVDLASRWS